MSASPRVLPTTTMSCCAKTGAEKPRIAVTTAMARDGRFQTLPMDCIVILILVATSAAQGAAQAICHDARATPRVVRSGGSFYRVYRILQMPHECCSSNLAKAWRQSHD